ITSIAVTGTNPSDFHQTNTCGTSVAAGSSCAISVTFAPARAGACSAAITDAGRATCSPQTAALSGSGVGVAQASLSPSTLTFANQNLATTSAPQTLPPFPTRRSSDLITSIAVTGTNPSDFHQTNTCGTSVAAGASCAISVTF